MVRSLLDASLRVLQCSEFLSRNVAYVSVIPANLKNKILTRLSSQMNGLSDPRLLEALTHEGITRLTYPKASHLQSLNLNASRNEFRIGVSPRAFLTSLYLRGNGLALDDPVFQLIQSDCPCLMTIDLSHCCTGLSQEALVSLRDLPLSSISLSGTNLTDAGLQILSEGRCTRYLVELKIDGCFEVVDSGVEAILASSPRLKVFLFDYSPKLSLLARRALDEYFRRYQ
ncbi:Uncharacterized protein FKW44_023423, partial [Caligus rogercresseyi]